MRRVNGSGPKSATLAIVGEAPGVEEEIAGIPFVGPSGKMLIEALRDNGIQRKDVYITNVVKYRPPDNKIDRLGELCLDLEHVDLKHDHNYGLIKSLRQPARPP